MGVYIKGMEMPQEKKITLTIFQDGRVYENHGERLWGHGKDSIPWKAVPAADAIKELSKLPWIPVTERLPEANERVIACVKTIEGLDVWDAVRWNGKEWEVEIESCYDYWTRIDEPVTHWMPLPEPPKEE